LNSSMKKSIKILLAVSTSFFLASCTTTYWPANGKDVVNAAPKLKEDWGILAFTIEPPVRAGKRLRTSLLLKVKNADTGKEINLRMSYQDFSRFGKPQTPLYWKLPAGTWIWESAEIILPAQARLDAEYKEMKLAVQPKPTPPPVIISSKGMVHLAKVIITYEEQRSGQDYFVSSTLVTSYSEPPEAVWSSYRNLTKSFKAEYIWLNAKSTFTKRSF
jgi:hypothetical protein